MRYSIGLTRLPLPQFVWASIDKQVEKAPLAPAETVNETATKEDDNV
jgi:hypothetical protein